MVTGTRRPVWGNTLAEDVDFNGFGGGNLDKFVRDLLATGLWADLAVSSSWLQSTSGSGVVSKSPLRLGLGSGETASSHAMLRTDSGSALQAGQQMGITDWSKVQALLVQFAQEYRTSTGVSRFLWGSIGGNERIGIRVEDLALKGEVCKAGNLTVVSLNTTLVQERVYKVMVVSDGQGNAEWFLDSGGGLVSVGSSTSAPIGTSWREDTVDIRVENGATAAHHIVCVSSCKLYVGR